MALSIGSHGAQSSAFPPLPVKKEVPSVKGRGFCSAGDSVTESSSSTGGHSAGSFPAK